MTAATSRLRRRGIGAGVAALVGLGSVVGLAGAAQAAPGFTFPDSNRVAGADRYATAIAASTKAFPTGTQAGGVVLVSGTSTVDGLTASYVAGSHNAPILLVKNGVIDADTLAEISRLNVTNVWIVGGTTVVPEGVETQLSGKTVVRYGGSDRYETASDAATNNGTVSTQPGKVFVASGTADALAAAPVLYNKKYPLLLTRPGSVPATTSDALDELTTTNVTVLGGTTAVDASTYTALGANARLDGANRYETATKVADSAVANEGFSRANVALANGMDTAAVDSLTGSVLAGKNGVPLIFGNGTDTNPAATTAYLTTNNAALTGQLYVFGGTTVVSAAAATAVVTTATAPVASSYTFAPTGAVLKTKSSGGASSDNAGVQQYTVSGLGTGAVNIQLIANTDVSGANLKVGTTAGLAALTAPTAGSLTVVNGIGATGVSAYNVTPINGSVTFTVDSSAAGGATPIVWSRTDSNNTLSVNASGTPTESSAIGGSITWLPAEAAPGNISSVGITAVDKSAGYLVAGSVYKWKSGDTYQIVLPGGTVNTSPADFLARVSAGDSISGSYSTTGSSNFILTDTAPVAPATATAALVAPTTTSVKLTIADSTTPSVGSYNVYRVAQASGTAPTALSAYTKIGSVNDTAVGTGSGTAATFTDTNASAATRYFYAVTSVDSTGQEGSSFTATSAVTTDAVAAATSPKSSSIAYNDGNANSRLDTGDVVTVTFDQATTVGSTWAVNLIDAANNAATISNSNATATVNSDGTLVTFTLTASPQVTAGAGPLILAGSGASGVEVLTATGIGNATGNWNVAGSGDRTIAGNAPAALKSAVTLTGNTGTTIAVAAANGLPAGSNLLRVYNSNGVVQAFATVTTTTAGDAVTATALNTTATGSTAANLPAGNYLVTYQNTTSGVTGLVSVSVGATLS